MNTTNEGLDALRDRLKEMGGELGSQHRTLRQNHLALGALHADLQDLRCGREALMFADSDTDWGCDDEE